MTFLLWAFPTPIYPKGSPYSDAQLLPSGAGTPWALWSRDLALGLSSLSTKCFGILVHSRLSPTQRSQVMWERKWRMDTETVIKNQGKKKNNTSEMLPCLHFLIFPHIWLHPARHLWECIFLSNIHYYYFYFNSSRTAVLCISTQCLRHDQVSGHFLGTATSATPPPSSHLLALWESSSSFLNTDSHSLSLSLPLCAMPFVQCLS